MKSQLSELIEMTRMTHQNQALSNARMDAMAIHIAQQGSVVHTDNQGEPKPGDSKVTSQLFRKLLTTPAYSLRKEVSQAQNGSLKLIDSCSIKQLTLRKPTLRRCFDHQVVRIMRADFRPQHSAIKVHEKK